MAAVNTAAAADPELDPRELEALLHLLLLPNTGDITLRPLLATCGSPSRALSRRVKELGERGLIALNDKKRQRRVARSLASIERLGVKVLLQSHPAYPERLLHLHDPPTALFLIGDVDLLHRDSISIVGARSCTPYGLRMAHEIATDIVRAGLSVCSGMALGIDSAAHIATLDEGGSTIAVLGCGVDKIYPARNTDLYRRIADHGLLVSEFVPGAHVDKHHFPRRNRIIAALSLGVVVVEASHQSGSLITADHALDIGRDVFAVPGPVGFLQSEGTNKLIQDGAKMVTSGSDVLRELRIEEPLPVKRRPPRVVAPPPNMRQELLSLWTALGDAPRHVDEIARESGVETGACLGGLLELEVGGYAKHMAGMLYVRANVALPDSL